MQENGMETCNENLPDEVIQNVALFELHYQVDEEGLSQLERNMQVVEKVVDSDISKMAKRALSK